MATPTIGAMVAPVVPAFIQGFVWIVVVTGFRDRDCHNYHAAIAEKEKKEPKETTKRMESMM